MLGAEHRSDLGECGLRRAVSTPGLVRLESRVGNEIDDPRVHWVGVGRRSQNVGITNLSVRKGYAGSFDYQAFVALGNYSGGYRQYCATQELGEAVFCIVDLHSITTAYEP